MKMIDKKINDLLSFSVLMLIDENSETAPEPFEKLNSTNFALIFGAGFFFAGGCEKDLQTSLDETFNELEE